jgi:hypothetical protein
MPKLIKPITKWIDWPDDPEAAVEIRAFTDEDTAAIRAAALRQKSTMVNGKAEMVVEYEVHRDREETARRRVVDWHGFNDENGRPMACTEANRLRWSCNRAFMELINLAGADLDAQAAAASNEAAKN